MGRFAVSVNEFMKAIRREHRIKDFLFSWEKSSFPEFSTTFTLAGDDDSWAGIIKLDFDLIGDYRGNLKKVAKHIVGKSSFVYKISIDRTGLMDVAEYSIPTRENKRAVERFVKEIGGFIIETDGEDRDVFSVVNKYLKKKAGIENIESEVKSLVYVEYRVLNTPIMLKIVPLTEEYDSKVVKEAISKVKDILLSIEKDRGVLLITKNHIYLYVILSVGARLEVVFDTTLKPLLFMAEGTVKKWLVERIIADRNVLDMLEATKKENFLSVYYKDALADVVSLLTLDEEKYMYMILEPITPVVVSFAFRGKRISLFAMEKEDAEFCSWFGRKIAKYNEPIRKIIFPSRDRVVVQGVFKGIEFTAVLPTASFKQDIGRIYALIKEMYKKFKVLGLNVKKAEFFADITGSPMIFVTLESLLYNRVLTVFGSSVEDLLANAVLTLYTNIKKNIEDVSEILFTSAGPVFVIEKDDVVIKTTFNGEVVGVKGKSLGKIAKAVANNPSINEASKREVLSLLQKVARMFS